MALTCPEDQLWEMLLHVSLWMLYVLGTTLHVLGTTHLQRFPHLQEALLCNPFFAAHTLLGSCLIPCDPDALTSLQGHLLPEDNDAVLQTLVTAQLGV